MMDFRIVARNEQKTTEFIMQNKKTTEKKLPFPRYRRSGFDGIGSI